MADENTNGVIAITAEQRRAMDEALGVKTPSQPLAQPGTIAISAEQRRAMDEALDRKTPSQPTIVAQAAAPIAKPEVKTTVAPAKVEALKMQVINDEKPAAKPDAPKFGVKHSMVAIGGIVANEWNHTSFVVWAKGLFQSAKDKGEEVGDKMSAFFKKSAEKFQAANKYVDETSRAVEAKGLKVAGDALSATGEAAKTAAMVGVGAGVLAVEGTVNAAKKGIKAMNEADAAASKETEALGKRFGTFLASSWDKAKTNFQKANAWVDKESRAVQDEIIADAKADLKAAGTEIKNMGVATAEFGAKVADKVADAAEVGVDKFMAANVAVDKASREFEAKAIETAKAAITAANKDLDKGEQGIRAATADALDLGAKMGQKALDGIKGIAADMRMQGIKGSEPQSASPGTNRLDNAKSAAAGQTFDIKDVNRGTTPTAPKAVPAGAVEKDTGISFSA